MENKSDRKTKENKRFVIITLIAIIALAVVGLRLFWIYILDGDKYRNAALSKIETDSVAISARRGSIVDADGVQLASSTQVYTLFIDPKLILSNESKYLEPTVALLERCFGFSADDMRKKIHDNPENQYVVLKRELPYSDIEEYLKITETDPDDDDYLEEYAQYKNAAGIFLENSYKRNYAYGTLACSVLGFMDQGVGAYGIEYMYDEELTGTDGREYTFINSDNVVEKYRKDETDGNTIRLTLKYNIQNIVENKIAEFIEQNPSQDVAVIIQDPNTGAILAMADSNTFDPNRPRDLSLHYTQEELDAMNDAETTDALSNVWRNFCISQSYEPGSTFKPFTVAAALEEDKIKTTDTYWCDGSLTFLEEEVHCHVRTGHGTLDVAHALCESCNVALMYMSQRIGAPLFCKYQAKFGFGDYTDIDLPNEMSCEYLIYNANNMSELDLATNSFGQNFNVTMIQLSTAFCSLINGGYYYKPYIVQGIYNANGELVKSFDKTLVSMTISPETGDFLKKAMRLVVKEGTGTAANMSDYVISGKTGTAEKISDREDDYLVSFIGFAPYESPEVVCYVVINSPSTGDESGVSAGFFNSIMSEVLPYLNVTPATLDTDPYPSSGGESDYTEPDDDYEDDEDYDYDDTDYDVDDEDTEEDD